MLDVELLLRLTMDDNAGDWEYELEAIPSKDDDDDEIDVEEDRFPNIPGESTVAGSGLWNRTRCLGMSGVDPFGV